MLLAEWVRLSRGYAERAGTPLASDAVLGALRWLEPERDTALVRALAADRLRHGDELACVWTGAKLRPGAIDIDHCLPWSAWACNDLWNLLPASAAANRRKSGLIVAAQALSDAKPRILAWWERGYLDAAEPIRARFAEEARSTLPLPPDRAPDLEDLFAALDFRRLRLRQETRLPEWLGAGTGPGRERA
jgi:hypothetical protein